MVYFITNNNHYNYTGIQELLTNPHPKFSAQREASKDFVLLLLLLLLLLLIISSLFYLF